MDVLSYHESVEFLFCSHNGFDAVWDLLDIAGWGGSL